MKYLPIFFVLVLFSLIEISCNDSAIKILEKKDSTIAFKDIFLEKDSVRFIIKQGTKVKIPLKEDTLEIELLTVDKLCVIENCGTCDVPTRVQLKLTKDNISYLLPNFELGFGNCQKSIFSPALCSINYPQYVISKYSFNNLIFSIIELTPYPQTTLQSIELNNKKLFYLKVLILNKC